jgi:hypothetical protein
MNLESFDNKVGKIFVILLVLFCLYFIFSAMGFSAITGIFGGLT